jgi:hypothetical protein
MKIAIIIMIILSIKSKGYLTINDYEININWFSFITLILFLIYTKG